MAFTKRALNGRERLFVEHMARTGDATYAAWKAGYGKPDARGSQNMRKPDVNQAVRKRTRELLLESTFQKAAQFLDGIFDDTRATNREKLSAAQIVLKFEQADDDVGLLDKEPHEMTPDERKRALKALDAIGAIEREANRPQIELAAEPIDNPPDGSAFD